MYIQGVSGGVYYTLGLGYDGEHLYEQDNFYCNFFEAFVVSACFWYFQKMFLIQLVIVEYWTSHSNTHTVNLIKLNYWKNNLTFTSKLHLKIK